MKMKRMICGKVWDTDEMMAVTGWVSTSEYGTETKLIYDEKSGFSFLPIRGAGMARHGSK
jgi:hypothetical protein